MKKLPKLKELDEMKPFVARNGFLTTEREIVRSYQSKGERIYNILQKCAPLEIDMIIRKMHPLAFEELIITALCDHRYLAYHGPKYSGDHGVDGWVEYYGEKHPIQIKRYNGTVPLRMIMDFSAICDRYQTEGLFIFTGKLPKDADCYTENMQLISGPRLIELLQREGNFYLVPEDALSEEDMNYAANVNDDEIHTHHDDDMDFIDKTLQRLNIKELRPGFFLMSCISFYISVQEIYSFLKHGSSVIQALPYFIFFLVVGLIFFIISKSRKEDDFILLKGNKIPKRKFNKYATVTVIIMYIISFIIVKLT